jgi:hypothetical protein
MTWHDLRVGVHTDVLLGLRGTSEPANQADRKSHCGQPAN